MKWIDKIIECPSRSTQIDLYPIGDVHLGSAVCAETPLKRIVKEVRENPNAYWFGGGDMLEAIKPQDSKRFDMDVFPDWMLEGDPMTVREHLNDVLLQQLDRFDKIFSPIADKCLGLIEGNHEYSIRKYYNENIHKALCNRLKTISLSDEAFLRLRFKRSAVASHCVIVYARHGYGGGRTAGAEPNKLSRLLAEWEEADVCFTGHTHTAEVAPPKPVLYLPRTGKLPTELYSKYRYAANWGCWLYSHASGPGSYASRACYPARPMVTFKAVFSPFTVNTKGGEVHESPHIEIRQITL